jgi:hypothetical protein
MFGLGGMEILILGGAAVVALVVVAATRTTGRDQSADEDDG